MACKFEAHNGVDSRLHKKLVDNFKSKGSQLAKLGKEFSQDVNYESQADDLYAYVHGPAFKEWFGDFTKQDLPNTDENGEPKLFQSQGQFYFERQDGAREYITGTDSLFSIEEQKQIFEAIRFKFLENLKEDDKSSLISFISKSENLKQTLSDKNINDVVQALIDDVLESEDLTDHQITILQRLASSKKAFDDFANQLRKFYSKIGIDFSKESSLNQDEDGNDLDETTSKDLDFSPSVESNPIKNASRALKVYLNHIPKGQIVNGQFQPINDSVLNAGTYESYGAVHKTLIRMFADTIQGDLTIDEYVDVFINKLRENQNELAWAGKIADDLQSMKDNKDFNALKQFIVGLNTHYYNYMLSTFNSTEVKYFSTSATESNVGRLLTRWNVSIINTAELDLNALTNVVESTSALQRQAKELIENGNSEAAINLFVNNIVDGLQALNVDVKPKAVRDLLKDEKYLGGKTELNRALTLSKFFDSFVTDLKSKQAKGEFYEGGETENKMVNIIKDNIFIRKLAEKQIVFIGEDINESVQRPKGQSYSYSKPSHIKDKLLFILNAKSGKSYINDLQTRSYYKYSKWLEYLDSDNADNVSIDMMSHFKEERVGDAGKDNKDIKIADELTMNIAMMLGRDEEGNPITPSFRTITAGDKSRAFHIKGFEIVQSMFETGQLSEEVIERAMGYLNAELERVIEVQGEIDAIENPEEGRAPVEKIMHYNTGVKNGLRVYFMPELSYEFYREAVEKEPNERSPEEIAIADLDKTIKAITKAAGLEERGLYNEKGRLLFGPNYSNEKVADSKKVGQDIQNAIKLTLNNLLMDKVTAGVEEMRSFYKYPGNEQGVIKLDKKVQSFYSQNRPGSQGDAVLGDYFINQMFANVEYTKMYTGDPAYYKNVSDFNKRVQGTYIDGDKGVFEDGNETFTIAVTESIEEASSQDILDEYERLIGDKVKSYNKNNVADAQAWISLGRWISIEKSLGRWSDTHEEIFNKISKDPTAELTKEEVKFVLDNHPPQSMKGVYFDVDKNGRPTYLKYSQAVLIPQLTQGSPILEKLVDKMTEGKIDEVITSDGIKVGAPADILDKNLDGTFTTLKLKATSWRLQQDLPTKGMKDQDVGSQIMKNILANIDPYNNYNVNGEPLTGKQLTDEIFRVINKMSNYGSDKLKAKLFDRDGNIRKEQINKIILDNLEDPDENLISALKRNVDYDSLPQFRVPIMNAIFAEVRKSIRPKTKGIGAIQVSAFGFERITDRSKVVWLKDAETDEDKVLNPPSEKNGYKGDVLISGSILNKMIQNTEPGKTYEDFIDYDSEGNIVSTERLFGVNGVLGELKDFGAIGYRIPNQGLSSNDALNIAGILPDIAGDIVVPYKEITTKTGSDFDIDKMYMMFKDVNPPLVREDIRESDKELIDELTETIFEEDDFKAKYVTPEEFENIQDANRLIDLYLSILTSENTIEQIITPLDSNELKNDIRKVAPEQTVNMFDPIENLKLKHKLKGGKNNVGGNANHLVNILYAQLGESKINSDLGVGHMENGVTLLNRFKDANTNEEKQEFITKTLSDFLTAFVDIGKDAYVVDANYNTKTSNIAFMLLRAGATKEWVTRFLKQPAIEMLLKEIEVQDASIVGFVEEKNRPFNKVKERILDQARANLSKAAVDRLSNLDADDATINTRNNFKIKRLTDNITQPSKNDNYYEDQITALVMFEKYKGLAQNLADFNQSMRSDVNGAGRDYSSLLAIKNTIAKVELDNVISGLQEVFNNTQVGTFYRNSVVVAQDIVNQLFNIGKTDAVVDDIGNEMMGSYITDEETIFQIHNSLYTFFHRTGAFEINEEKQEALFKDQQGSPSLATRIYNLQKLQKREGFNQEGKFLIDSLVVNFEKIGADKVRHGFIQLPSSTKSGSDFRQNVYESWLELLKSNDPRFRKIGEDLIQYGFYSTGFQKTLGSIYEFIPNEWFFRNNHTSSVQTKFDDFDVFSEEAMDFVYKANMFENKFVPRLSKDQVKSIERIADMSGNKAFRIDIKEPRRFVKIVSKNGSILLFKLRGLDETGKAIYAREATIREKIGSVYRFKFPDNPNMLNEEDNAFVDSLVVTEEDTNSLSADKEDAINDVTTAVDDAQTTEEPQAGVTAVPTTQPQAGVEVVSRYSDADVKANPNKIYVFGDNNQRKGKGGQATIRDNENAFGISTKLKPSNSDDAFMTDDAFEENKRVIDSDIAKIKNDGRPIIFPKDGLGTGLAKLKTKAPKTYAYLKQRLLEEFGFDNDTGTIVQPTQPQTAEVQDFSKYKDKDWNTTKAIGRQMKMLEHLEAYDKNNNKNTQERLMFDVLGYLEGYSDKDIKSHPLIKEIEEAVKKLRKDGYSFKFIKNQNLFYIETPSGEFYSNRPSSLEETEVQDNDDSVVLQGDLILPIGISGSGKSTWIKTLPKDINIVSPDDIRRELTGDVSDQSRNREVFQEVDRRLNQLLSEGKKVVLDATNLNTKLRKQLMNRINKEFPGKTITYKVLSVDADVAKQRVKKDISAGVDRSAVPEAIIDRQKEMFDETMKSLDSENFSNNAFKETLEDTTQPASVKEEVSELFESNPELATAVYKALGFEVATKDIEILPGVVGKVIENVTPQQKQEAQQQYSQYLDSIFPDSKVKDIVYHGTKRPEKTFEKQTPRKEYGSNAIYFANKDYAATFGNLIPAILNITTPFTSEQKFMRRRLKPGYESPQGTIDARDLLFQNKNNDGLVGVDYSDQENNTYVIREPEQIHILGSKQDVEGFKEFVSTQPAAAPKEVSEYKVGDAYLGRIKNIGGFIDDSSIPEGVKIVDEILSNGRLKLRRGTKPDKEREALRSRAFMLNMDYNQSLKYNNPTRTAELKEQEAEAQAELNDYDRKAAAEFRQRTSKAVPKEVLLEAEADVQTAEQYLPNMQLGDTFEILFSSEPNATYKKANLVDFNAGQQTSGNRMELGLFIEGESSIRRVDGVMFSDFPEGSVKIKSLQRKSLPEANPDETENIKNCKGEN